MRIQEARDLYVAHIFQRPDLAAATKRAYVEDVEDAVRFLLSRRRRSMAGVTEADLDAYRDRFADCSPNTAERRFRVLSRWFSWLVENGHVARHPMRGYAVPSGGRGYKRTTGAIARREMADAITDEDPVSLRDRAILEVMLATGMSAKAASELRADSIDLQAETIRLGSEVVKLDRRAVMAVRRYVRARNEYIQATGAPLNEDALWVSFSKRSRGRRIQCRSVYDILAAREVSADACPGPSATTTRACRSR